MSTLTQLIGGKHQITIGEETVVFSPITTSMEAEFERRLFSKTLKSVEATIGILSPIETSNLHKSIVDAYALGAYKLVGGNGMQALSTINGLAILANLVTGIPEDKMTNYVKNSEFMSTILLVIKESFGELLG